MNRLTRGTLNARRIFKFWVPIAATWWMMSVEGPFLAAVIARLPDLEYNLAAYGIAFSIGLFIEAPIMMLISASVALVRENRSYLKLRGFTLLLNGIITICMLLFAVPGVFRWFAMGLMGLPEALSNLAHVATILLIPWPAAIGFRRFYQGILIHGDKTRRVAYGTVIRLAGMATTASILAIWTDLPGAWVGCSALSVGVTVEALATWIMAWHSIREIRHRPMHPEKVLTYRKIWTFYYPLAMSSMMALGIRPVISFFVAHCPRPIESLAVLPVVYSASFLFVCFGLSFQEVALALMGDRFERFQPVFRFAVRMSAVLTVAITVAAFTPLARLWFMVVSDLPAHLTDFAAFPFRLTIVLPVLAVAHSLQRAILVNAKRNAPISRATAMEVVIIAISMVVLSKIIPVTGVIAAIVSLILGRMVSNTYLATRTYTMMHRKQGMTLPDKALQA